MKKSDVTRQKIFDAAETEFCDMGLYGARVDSIAAAAGVNKRMIYQYFGNKEGLYTTVLHGVYARLADLEVPLLERESDCKEAVKKLVLLYFTFLKDNQSFVRMIMWENLCAGQYFDAAGIHAVKDSATEALKGLVRRGKVTGAFRADVDETSILLAFHTFCFPYFSNIHTLSKLLDIDLSGDNHIKQHADFVSRAILAQLS